MSDLQQQVNKLRSITVAAILLLSATNIIQVIGVIPMATKKASRRASTGGPPANETPAQAFQRLAVKRTNKAVKTMNMICGLTGAAYVSTDTEKNAIITALQAAVDTVKDSFAGKGKDAGGFSLPE